MLADLTIGISCLHYEWRTVEEAFSRAGDLGFDLIEFSTDSLADDGYDRCATLSRESRIATSLHAWGDPASLEPNAAADELLGLLSRCQRMGARHLISHLGSYPRRDIGLERLIYALAAVAGAFERAGVLLCLENHYPYHYRDLNELGGEPEDFLAVFDEVTSPAARFCLDYGHSHMAGNTDDFIARLSPWLAYTHIADNLGEHDDHLAPEDGTVDWPQVLRQTLATGFRGPFTIEFPEQGDPSRFTRFLQVLEAAIVEQS